MVLVRANAVHTFTSSAHTFTSDGHDAVDAECSRRGMEGKNPCCCGKVLRMSDDLRTVLAAVGPRLRTLRKQRGVTLEVLSTETGISVSTLSRLESGNRRPTLEMLLGLARAHHVCLDELVDAPTTGDPRARPRPVQRNGITWVPLARNPGSLNAFKQILPVDPHLGGRREQREHEGYEWVYILGGRLRLALADQDYILTPGEAAEFDTRVPHGYANVGTVPLELLIMFGEPGARIQLRVRTATKGETPIPCVPAG
jgi:transcriptional regulator with XRE-family HTH domain